MIRLRKWNFETHEYEPFEVPDDRRLVLYTENMAQEIDCTNCGKDMTYGDGYTSKTIHNPFGIGFPVCENCYESEVKDEQASKLASR